MKRYLILFIALMLPILAFAYTDVEILQLIDKEIENYTRTVLTVVTFFLMGVGLLLGWLFYMINSNRSLLLQLETTRHEELASFIRNVEENYNNIEEKLNRHKLHIANNYIRDEKVEKLLEHAIKPLQDQITTLNSTIMNHFKNISKH